VLPIQYEAFNIAFYGGFELDYIKKYIMSNTRLKILSLLLACMLWFATTYLGESHVTMAIPVQLANLNRNCVTRAVDTRELLVTLNGPLSLLKNVKPGDVSLVIDLSKAREGRQIVTVRKSDIVVPKGIRVEEVRPDYVVLEVDRTVEKYLPIIVKLDEKLAKEYSVLSWSPQHVLVEGSKQVLEDREAVETVPITSELLNRKDAVETGLNTKELCAKKVSPDTVKVVLKKLGK
jgi:YbbR domain-containing protein